jgi:DNA-directed RNA polymerase subunit H (RpoH/RPB5)
MDLTTRINKTRFTLKKHLEKEWDTSIIQDYSDKEIENIYTNKVAKKSNLISFGHASGCNFSLTHRKIPNHKLHIIYYNFPELNTKHVKITKTCADKIQALYTKEIINREDSVIVIVLEKVSENLNKSIEEVYLNGQEELVTNGLSDLILQENEGLDESQKLSIQHFRNIHIFYINHLSIDITNHINVPYHECIRDKNKINSILEKCNTHLSQLPIILRSDPQAKVLRLAPNDICRIVRTTQTAGDVDYYRVCV